MSLKRNTMLIMLNIRAWTARKFDRKVSEEVESNHNARDSGRWNKILISKEATGKLQKIASEARTYHYNNTLPWLDSGGRLLPATNYFDYVEKIRDFKNKYDKGIQMFIDEYIELIEDAKIRLSDMFKESDYPPISEIEKKYSFETKVFPIPVADDFRVDIDAEEVAEIKEKIEKQVKDATKLAMNDLWSRLFIVVSHMLERLSVPDNKFKNSLITNIIDICKVLPKLNITNDPNLSKLVLEVRDKLSIHDPRNLRNNRELRESVTIDAKKILAKMRPYMGE